MTRAWIGGTFDLIHLGHARLFEFAAKNFDELIVAVNTDESVEKHKGKLPIFSLDERIQLLLYFKYITKVIPNLGENSIPCILENNITHLVSGPDWKPKENYMARLGIDQEWLDRHKIQVVFFEDTYRYHGQDIKQRIRSNS